MERTLVQHGYTVLNTENAGSAIGIAERQAGQIDLLLTDIIMPGLSGPDLAQRIIRLKPTIKVLYVSGFSNPAAFANGAMSPRICFLPKPFTPHVLAAKVRECLDASTANTIGT